jgi:uncharacterized protein YndB with AHSA1/START domain
MSDNAISKDAIVIERIFDPPVEVIWQMWTQPEHFKNWYGPKGFSVPVAEIDVRVGGKRLICMESPDGTMKMCTAGEHTEVAPNERLAYTESMADENGNVVAPPSDEQGHPGTTLVTVQLESLGGRTKMTMTHAGVAANSPGATGWEQAFAKMADHIEAVLNAK